MPSISEDDLGPPPSKIRLVLSEAARKFPPSLGGEYHLGQGLTNEKNFWVHRCGHSAIWWNDQGWFWCIGVHEKLGGNLAGIVGPCDNINWPISITKGWRYFNGTTWASAKTEDVRFLDCTSSEEPTIPFTLCLQLSGKPKTVQWRRAGVIDGSAKTTNGIYNVGSKDVNGYPHWVHENNKQAIWFNKISKSWFIGDIEDLGENAAGISGPKGDDSMPTTISCGWRYAEELENDKPSFVDAKEGDIAFKDFSKAHI